MPGEQQLIDRIRRRLAPHARLPHLRDLRIGIGDDAAVLRAPRRAEWVVTCDAFLENVHFLGQSHPPEAVGYKALARATSDLAAMGAAPRFFLLTMALPPHRAGAWLDRFLAGLARAARKFGMVLVGGDTSRYGSVAVSITVIGEIVSGRAVTRAHARPGDLIYVSGVLGAAQLGLELILRGLHRDPAWMPLLRPHLYPELRLALGAWLARRRLASAMIDTSDGLSTDLEHLCRASGVGARLWADCIPAVRVPAPLRRRALDAVQLSLHGGEDYELLFTVPRRFRKSIPAAHRDVRLTAIGEITREREICLVGQDGRAVLLRPRGWDHFRS